MEAVRIREGVETEEEVLTGAAIVERQAGRMNGSLAKGIEEARRIAAEKAGKKTAEEKYDDLKETTDGLVETTDELVETMADILGGAI